MLGLSNVICKFFHVGRQTFRPSVHALVIGLCENAEEHVNLSSRDEEAASALTAPQCGHGLACPPWEYGDSVVLDALLDL